MIPDPRPRKDGLCVVCLKSRRVVKPQKGVPISVYEREPFCSNTCAREFFGASLPATTYVDPDAEGQAA